MVMRAMKENQSVTPSFRECYMLHTSETILTDKSMGGARHVRLHKVTL